MALNGDLIEEILGRVDSITLANAGCVSSEFWSIAGQESMWEEACCSIWPSTNDTDIKELISSSFGGFRKFYKNCFPSISYETTMKDSKLCTEPEKLCGELQALVPSDYVFLVDLQHMNKVIYSRVVWGIPDAGDFENWFCNCPFRIDLINFLDVEDEDQGIADHGLPTVVCIDKVRKDDKFLGQLMDNFKLSWIMINRRTGQAANLSSWRPLVAQRHSDADFVMRFGSILPAGHHILPSKVVQCILVIKFRLSDSDHASLKITELGMQLEDMMGAHVNGRNSLLILERALGCRKSKDHDQILVSYKKYMAEQSKLREAKMRNEDRLDTLCTLSGIVAFASFCYFIFVQSDALMGI